MFLPACTHHWGRGGEGAVRPGQYLDILGGTGGAEAVRAGSGSLLGFPWRSADNLWVLA